MKWRQRERVPLPKGAELTIKGITFVNDDEKAAEGSSCLVYRGHIKNDQEEGAIPNSVIIKEFYPDTMNEEVVFDIQRDTVTNMLVVGESTKEKEEYRMRYTQFRQGLESQKGLASSEAMEIAVKPLYYGKCGDSYYIISDIHRGDDLKKKSPVTLKEKLNVAVCVAETMEILHETGYMMPDFKSENLLWINKPNLIKIIDTDSLIQYRDSKDMESKRIFSNYGSAVMMIEAFNEQGISRKGIEDKKKFYLQPASDMYAIGKYLYQIFWNQLFPGEDFADMDQEALMEEFLSIYANEAEDQKSKLHQLAKELTEVLSRMIISDSLNRKIYGYKNAGELMNALNDSYFGYTSKKYVPRKDIAKANATFVAYNMLQKYPLFEYANVEDGIRQLKVVLAGDHAMRTEMLSAMISIGQMTDSELTVSVVAEDARAFWEDYISEEKNTALKSALTWSVDEELLNDRIDEKLVARSLAHVNIITDTSREKMQLLKEEGYRYYILLAEEGERNQKWAQSLMEDEADKAHFIGYLQDDEEAYIKDSVQNYCCWPISSRCYSEQYNEKIFEEKIFDMGLMVHAYYYGCLDKIDEIDMEELKESFCKNIYDVGSSERCALHAMYKMACVGLYGNVPRKAAKFEKKLSDPKVLEELAWIEHLSWTASLLTAGAQPELMDDFDNFAYQGDNDWKNKKDPTHLGHVLLVSSKKTLPEADWQEEGSYEKLDELDRVSYKIYKWFVDHKEDFRKKNKELLSRWIPENETEQDFYQRLEDLIDQCIDGMGEGAMDQDTTNTKAWKKLVEDVKGYTGKSTWIKELENAMRPVVDSYKDRDFKELDRKLVYVAADIVG